MTIIPLSQPSICIHEPDAQGKCLVEVVVGQYSIDFGISQQWLRENSWLGRMENAVATEVQLIAMRTFFDEARLNERLDEARGQRDMLFEARRNKREGQS